MGQIRCRKPCSETDSGMGFFEFTCCLSLTRLLWRKVSLGTGTAERRSPPGYDWGFSMWVMDLIPTQAGLSLRTGDLFLLPAHDKAGETMSPSSSRLP